MKNPVLVKLKKIRSVNEITIKSLSNGLGISKTMYLYVENGTRRLSYELAYKIACLFKMTPDELFFEDTCLFLNNSFI